MNCSNHFDSLESNSGSSQPESPANHHQGLFHGTLTIRRNQLYDANNVPSHRATQTPEFLDSAVQLMGSEPNHHNLKGVINAKSRRPSDWNGPHRSRLRDRGGLRKTFISMVNSFRSVLRLGGSPKSSKGEGRRTNNLNNNSRLDNESPTQTGTGGKCTSHKSGAVKTGNRDGTRGVVSSGAINRKCYDKLPTIEDTPTIDDHASSIVSPMSIGTTITASLTPASEVMDMNYANYWDEEELTCQVCDRSFATPNLLERHQQKRRHWGCSICEALFDSLMLLEHHKEEHEHWSDEGFSDTDSDANEAANWRLDELRHYQQESEMELQETAFGPDAQMERKMLLL